MVDSFTNHTNETCIHANSPKVLSIRRTYGELYVHVPYFESTFCVLNLSSVSPKFKVIVSVYNS